MAEDETTTTAPESQEDTEITCTKTDCNCGKAHLIRSRT